MQTVVLSILILGCLICILKLSFAKPWWVVAWSVVMAIGTGLSGQLAATQSKTQIADFLSNPAMMADMAVLLTVEISIMVAFCIQQIQCPSEHNNHRFQVFKQVFRIFVEGYPGALLFVAVFCLLTLMMFRLTGVSFTRISWTVGAALAVMLPTAVWVIRKLSPKREQRLELLFFLNMAVAALGIVATVNGRTAVEGTDTVDWPNLLALVAIVAATAALGWMARSFFTKRSKH